MIVCPKCDVVVSLNDDPAIAKMSSHQLWYHPTPEDVADCYQDMEDKIFQMGVMDAGGHREYAALYAADLVDLVMRYRRYMESKL